MKAATLKARDLKPLSEEQLLLLGARLVLRVAAWSPAGARASWDKGLALLLSAGGGVKATPRTVAALARELQKRGTLGVYGTEPKVTSYARASAANALVCALQATQLAARKERWKEVALCAKHAGSVFARQAHAGRVPIEQALPLYWAAVRADVACIAQGSAPSTAQELLALGPLWPEGSPDWAHPQVSRPAQ